jgi:hypothetical protein
VVDQRGPANSAPTIGRPIANTQAYVLDRAMRPVPIGVAGELYVGGASLSRGYWRRPELTAERFVPSPFDDRGAHPSGPAGRACLYRTGDLVRWTEAGELEFLGRLDGQVKVRGCRIELGEVEATLQQYPAVRECLVLTRPGAGGQMQLVAYVVRSANVAGASDSELVDFLRRKLPAYMVPSACILLDAWPLTPNGKIDRAALPAPEEHAVESRAPFAPPRSSSEQVVAKVWAEVLGRGEIGLEDNFFDLGGHSLLAAQVITRLNALLQASVSVRALFDQPTLAAFAREVEQRLDGNGGLRSPLHRVKRRGARAEMELVPPN